MSGLNRGDTLIEVLLAFSVFSLVSVATMTIMNQGSNAAQRALEITLVRQQLDAQAEALRAAQKASTVTDVAADSTWSRLALGAGGDSEPYDGVDCPTSSQLTGSFIMDTHTATLVETGGWYNLYDGAGAPVYAQVNHDGGAPRSFGMWIEREYIGGTPEAYNFSVRACWFGAGLNVPMQLKTNVRLYDPVS